MVKDYSTKEVPDKSTLYGFTLRINGKKEPTHEDYVRIISQMSKYVDIVYFEFEDKDKEKKPVRLHLHGIFDCPKQPYFKSVIGDNHIQVERIYDVDGWYQYCGKNVEVFNHNKYMAKLKIDNTQYMF